MLPADDFWVEHAELTGTGGFGVSASISGDRILVGSVFSGSVRGFRRDDLGTPSDASDDRWIEEARLTVRAGTVEMASPLSASTRLLGVWCQAGAWNLKATDNNSGSMVP